MKAICQLSGLEFTASQLNFLTANKNSKLHSIKHPIFSLTVKEVLDQLPFASHMGALHAEDTHLVGTFLLSKLPIAKWEVPLLSTLYPISYWESFWLKNMQPLSQLALQLEGKTWKRLPQFNIYAEDCIGAAPASNLADWIKETHSVIREQTQPISDEARKKNREFNAAITEHTYLSEAHCKEIIQKGLQGSLLSAKETKMFPSLLAKWARKVGEFPSARIQLASGKKVTIADFWESTLEKGFKLDGTGLIDLIVSDITVGDIEEILEHCTTTILQDDSVISMAFFKELANIADALQDFRSPSVATKRAISMSSGEELLNLISGGEVSNSDNFKSLRQTDEHSPKREDYKSMKDYLAARREYSASKTGATADSLVNI